MNTEIKYSVVSKVAGNTGRKCLVSFASKPMWKDYENLRRQEQTAGDWDKKTADYALNKYANKEGYEVVIYSTIEKELSQYKKDNPNWQ